ncbi:MAG: YcaO-like family protein [Alphaproteobacteria bacterium]|nr:YcaO-like family protein [Alphaproteobacteria bacterium]
MTSPGAPLATANLPAGLAGFADDVKRYREGTHRVVDPDTTLARVQRFADEIGLTRLGMITGLDRVGIPVAVACRPNSRSLATFQGKGLTAAAARVSAFMEALESFHAEAIAAPLRLASWNELRAEDAAVDPRRLPLCRASALRDDRGLLWIAGDDLVSGRRRLVPFELVSARFTTDQPPGSWCFAASTNGLASGNTPLEAIAHALYETIERDALALWLRSDAPTASARALDPSRLAAPAAADLVERCRRAGLRVALWNATSDIAIPVVACLLQSEAESVVDMGSGCHADREIALLRAITEAAQARLTRIAGAREDVGDDAYPDDPGLAPRVGARWFPSRADGDLAMLPSAAGDSLRADVAATLAALAARGLDEVVHVDLARPGIGVPVARVIVPGLEGPAHATDIDYVPGARARALRAS